MGVIAKNHKGAWWVFINHRGQRKAKRGGERTAALELKAKIEARLSAGDLGILEKPILTFAERIPRYHGVMTHAFRHSWATWILQNAPTPGAILYVSRQLGHSSIKITLDICAHVIPEENRHLSDRLAQATIGTATTCPPPATGFTASAQSIDFPAST